MVVAAGVHRRRASAAGQRRAFAGDTAGTGARARRGAGPDSVAGGQLRWLLASSWLPIGDAELRAHFSKWFLLAPGQSPAELNAGLEGAAHRAAGRRSASRTGGDAVHEPDRQ